MKRLLLAAAMAATPGLAMAKTYPFGPVVLCSYSKTEAFISQQMPRLPGLSGFSRLVGTPQQQSQSSCLITWRSSDGATRVGTFTFEYDPAAEMQNLPLRLILNYQDG